MSWLSKQYKSVHKRIRKWTPNEIKPYEDFIPWALGFVSPVTGAVAAGIHLARQTLEERYPEISDNPPPPPEAEPPPLPEVPAVDPVPEPAPDPAPIPVPDPTPSPAPWIDTGGFYGSLIPGGVPVSMLGLLPSGLTSAMGQQTIAARTALQKRAGRMGGRRSARRRKKKAAPVARARRRRSKAASAVGRMKKGSAAAKAWGRKMKRLRGK